MNELPSRLWVLSEIERLARQRIDLVTKWEREKPPRPSHVIDGGRRDIQALRDAYQLLKSDEKAEMNGQDYKR